MINIVVFQNLFRLSFCVLLFSFSVLSQKPDDDVIKINTDLITFEATVTDAQGKPVRDLKQENFKILENGIERPIAFFEQQKRENFDRPMSIVFALDVSGSMTAEEMMKLRLALSIFTKRLGNPASYFSVTTFGMRVKTLQSFTNKADRLERAFDKLLKESDGLSTHAYDAVDDAIRSLNKDAPRTDINRVPMRKVVILVTDGFPVGDTVAPATVIERANASQVSVFNLILPSYLRRQVGQSDKKPLPTPLDISGLSDKTGGTSFYLTGDNYDVIFGKLAEEITATYLLAFYPDDVKNSEGKFHPVKIEVKSDQPKNLNLKQNRAGYTIQSEKGN